MRFAQALCAVVAATQCVAANSWFPGAKAVYNRWHETELERWLSDHEVPYPTPADRKDLESLVEKHWDDYVVSPFNSWTTTDLSGFLRAKGKETQDEAAASRDSLVSQVKTNWYESEEQAQKAWTSVKDWILDTWTESQLKAFCDKHNVPVPQPRQRDAILQKARSNYETIAKKAGEAASYPGNWLYETWSESELKEWLDAHGFPAPQPSTRDRLVASVRRNSRLAYLRAQDQAASASASAQAAYATLTDMIIDVWGESQLKEFCDKNGIPVPQGTKINELRALVRKNRAEILGDHVAGKASSVYGAATSNVHGQYAKATDSASLAAKDAFKDAVSSWSDSRLKAYLDARGIPVPQGSKKDELMALVRKNSHKAVTGWSAWTFDDFTIQNLKEYLVKYGDATAQSAAKKKDATREKLLNAAQSAYSSATAAGSSELASATNYLASVAESTKEHAFDTWSESELKAYLDSYGVPVPQGSSIEKLKAEARKQSTYFKYGTASPSGTLLAQVQDNVLSAWNWIARELRLGSEAAQDKAAEAKGKAKLAAEDLRQDL